MQPSVEHRGHMAERLAEIDSYTNAQERLNQRMVQHQNNRVNTSRISKILLYVFNKRPKHYPHR